MTIKSTGALSFSEIQTDLLGTAPISISEYYGKAVGLPTSGIIRVSDFYGKTSNANPVYGTLLTTYCSGTTKMGTYANGSGGTYTGTIATNSVDCGYVQLYYTYNTTIFSPVGEWHETGVWTWLQNHPPTLAATIEVGDWNGTNSTLFDRIIDYYQILNTALSPEVLATMPASGNWSYYMVTYQIARWNGQPAHPAL